MKLCLIIVVPAVCALVIGTWAAFWWSKRQFVGRLCRFSGFRGNSGHTGILAVEYARPSDPGLRELAEKYRLAQIAGGGSDVARAIAPMRWVHGLGHHTPNPPRPERLDALHLIRLCTEENRRLNCWLFATILNDVYLALGFASRIVHLKPYPEAPRESHVVTCVYLNDLGRWVLMDADMRGFLVDERGGPLGVLEARERLAAGRKVHVNDDADMAHVRALPRGLRKALYRWYLSKNMFRYDGPARSEPDYESQQGGRTYIGVLPAGYRSDWLVKPRVTSRGNTIISTTDAAGFWAPPR